MAKWNLSTCLASPAVAVAVTLSSLPTTTTLSLAGELRLAQAKKRDRTKLCRKREKEFRSLIQAQKNWRGGSTRAFAMSKDRVYCGWSGFRPEKEARAEALEHCELRARKKCYVTIMVKYIAPPKALARDFSINAADPPLERQI